MKVVKHYEIKVSENYSYFVDGDGMEQYFTEGIANIYRGTTYDGTFEVVTMVNIRNIIAIIETGDSKK